MPSSEPFNTPLWAFSLAVYGRDGVADECLALQERLKLDVNLLLFVAFAGAVEGLQLDKRELSGVSAACAGWHSEIVRTLRAARQALKAPSEDAGSALKTASAMLRLQVKAAELESERIEQAMLWQWSRDQLSGRPRGDADQALAANIGGLLGVYGLTGEQAAASAAAPRLLVAAAAYARSKR